MSKFAKILDGKVVNVIVAEPEFFDTYVDSNPGIWLQTSYNTFAGKHPEGRPLRKNYAGIGYSYDSVRDAFIPPQPYASWLLDEETCQWQAPVVMPADGGAYGWDEETHQWVSRKLEVNAE